MSAAVATKPKVLAQPVADITWGTPLQDGGAEGRHLAMACAYDLDSIARRALSEYNNRFGRMTCEDHAASSIERMRYQRIHTLNSLLMSYLNDDGVTLREAYRKVYGESPAPAQQPDGALA